MTKEELRKEFDRHMNFSYGTSTNIAPVHAGDDRFYSNSQVNIGQSTITMPPNYDRAFEWFCNEIEYRDRIIKRLEDEKNTP